MQQEGIKPYTNHYNVKFTPLMICVTHATGSGCHGAVQLAVELISAPNKT
jgi:hypothetical protein